MCGSHVVRRGQDTVRDGRNGSFSTEAADFAARPTSGSPRKLTSVPNEKFVAMGQQQTHAAQQINSIIRSHRQREPRASAE